MVYVFRSAAGSESGPRLAEELNGMSTKRPPQAGANDTVVCWGSSLQGENVLNGGPILSKLTSARKLAAAGVRTITVAEQPPAANDPANAVWAQSVALARDFEGRALTRNEDYRNRVISLVGNLNRLHNALGQPFNPGEWLARTTDHQRASDLLNPGRADFWVKKEDIRGEVRVHSFDGLSIGAGRKVKTRPDAHPWIRSIDSGWDESYGEGRNITEEHRQLAHRAVAALELDFGAVDIGELADGSLMVLEVNRAPGIDGWLVGAYAKAINRWMRG